MDKNEDDDDVFELLGMDKKIYLYWWSSGGIEYSNIEVFKDRQEIMVSFDEDLVLDSICFSNN